MATISTFEEIESWIEARELAKRIYDLSRGGPCSRDFALSDQMRRACISIMSNIAEGFERNGNREFAHFLSIAKGSCAEVRSLLYIALDAGYLDESMFRELYNRTISIRNLIFAFSSYLRKNSQP